MQLYIANKNYSSWSLRPWLTLTELGIGFEEKLVPFDGATNWDRFRAFSPNGRVPCLVDGETRVWESLAIVEYLAEREPRVWPEAAPARAWARSAAAEMHAGFATLRGRCPMNVGLRMRLAAHPPELQHDLARVDELWRDGLQRFGGPFLGGARFGAVDAFFAPVVFRIQTYGLAVSADAQAYAARLLALPSLARWQREALIEPWRDTAHEEQVRQSGTVLDDRRGTPA